METRAHTAPRPVISEGRTIRVLLADDHIVVRQGLRALLDGEPDIQVIDLVASDGWLAVEIARRERPDIVIMDVNMRGQSGIDATHTLSAEGIKVIGLSMDEHCADLMLDAGAVAFLTKDAPISDLVAAIRDAMQPSRTARGWAPSE